MSPDDPATIAPLLDSNLVFLGPGSPTYAARQLQDSLAWYTLTGLHRLGAAVVFASAATVAAGALVLPVYEIFKAGQDLHWQPGLDFFGAYGLPLVFVPHFNNAEGGAGLDTSRCFMGRARFDRLLALLPTHVTVVGIDEHTTLIMDICAGRCRVMGRGGITVIKDGETRHFLASDSVPTSALGGVHVPRPESGLPEDVWASVRAVWFKRASAAPAPPAEVVNLSQERSAARARGDWAQADALRQRIATLGWEVRDTPDGLILEARPFRGRQNDARPFSMAEAG